MTPEVWTIQALMKWTESFFKQKGFADSARLDTQLLLAYVLGCKRIDLYVRSAEVPTEEQRSRFKGLMKRRVEGTPVDYLIGTREFYLLTFDVTPDVLIPREDTAFLVMEAIRLLKERHGGSVLDLGTGSGCIAISVAHQFKTAEVTASDISEAALGIARRNAEKHAMTDIRFLEGDLFKAIPAGQTFDLILSNPPYIAEDEFAGLDVGVRDHEPRLALFGGEDGLDYYRRIAQDAPEYLMHDGWLLLEIGYRQDDAVRGILEATTRFRLEPTLLDKARHPRVVRAQRIS